jgi:hypothetical protein
VRTLFLDIETTPHVAYTWGLHQENIGLSQVVEPTRMLCVAWMFGGEDPQFAAEWTAGGTAKMRERIWLAIDEADAIVHYNGVSFDEKHLNREFLEERLAPPSSYKTIDLYRTIKQRFRFASSKLEQVMRQLDLGQEKIRTDFSLWRRVLEGDKAARAEMREYNIRDVTLLQDLYEELKPWIERHPNVALIDGVGDWRKACTRCASEDLVKNGLYYTSAGAYQKYRCKECGAESRDPRRNSTAALREVPR